MLPQSLQKLRLLLDDSKRLRFIQCVPRVPSFFLFVQEAGLTKDEEEEEVETTFIMNMLTKHFFFFLFFLSRLLFIIHCLSRLIIHHQLRVVSRDAIGSVDNILCFLSANSLRVCNQPRALLCCFNEDVYIH